MLRGDASIEIGIIVPSINNPFYAAQVAASEEECLSRNFIPIICNSNSNPGLESWYLEMLEEKAMEFEETSYRGLFNFIRYIENLQKYQVDFGEVSTIGENEDTVRIMSIHKSKGLEFPVVFVSGLGKRFNMTDANAGLVIHPDLAWDAMPSGRDCGSRRRPDAPGDPEAAETGEPGRGAAGAVCGADPGEGAADSHRNRGKTGSEGGPVAPALRTAPGAAALRILENASSFWGWILPALARHPAFDVIWQRIGRTPDPVHICRKDEAQFAVRCVRGAPRPRKS